MLSHPVRWEVDHHTPKQTPSSYMGALVECANILRWHTDDNGWADIGYNFLVWDRYIFEGRGWGRSGAHAGRVNGDSIGIAFLLDSRVRFPTQVEWWAAETIMRTGVELGRVHPAYRRSGHRDHMATACPGPGVYLHLHDPRPPVGVPVTESEDGMRFNERPGGFDDPGIPGVGQAWDCVVPAGRTIVADQLDEQPPINVVFYNRGQRLFGEHTVARWGEPVLFPTHETSRWSVVAPADTRLSVYYI